MLFAKPTMGINRVSILLRRRAACINSSSTFHLGYTSIDDNCASLSTINHHYSSTSLLQINPNFHRADAEEGKLENSKRIDQLKQKIKVLKEGGQPKQTRLSKSGVQQVVKRKVKHSPEAYEEEHDQGHLRPIQPKYSKPALSKPLRGPFSVFIACLPGLEPLLLQEVQHLQTQWENLSTAEDDAFRDKSIQAPKAVPGGVKVMVPNVEHIYVLHLYIGTASHIYLRLNDDNARGIPNTFRARGFPELQRKLKDLIVSQQWEQLLNLPRPKKNKNAKRDRSGAEREKAKIPKRAEADLPWELQVHVTTSKSKLMHTKAVEDRVRETIGDVLGIHGLKKSTANQSEEDAVAKKPMKKTKPRPMVRLFVRIDRDIVQLSLDTSSSSSAIPLHMRGYRLDPFKAPLREDLAYAMLMAGGLKSSWNLAPLRSLLVKEDTNPLLALLDGSVRGDEMDTGIKSQESSEENISLQLFDPLCGSGTIAIEGASILAGLPPGRLRSTPLQGTQLWRPKLWNDMKSKVMNKQSSKKSVDTINNENSENDNEEANPILVAANDINRQAIEAAQSNAKRAGVDKFIDFKVGSFKIHPLLNSSQKKSGTFEVSKTKPLKIVTNPPYGKRLSPKEPTNLIYKQLAKALSSSPYETQYTLIGKDPKSLRQSALPLDVAFSTKHGGLSVVAMSGMTNRDKPEVSSMPLQDDVELGVSLESLEGDGGVEFTTQPLEEGADKLSRKMIV